MPIQKQPININFSQGVDKKTDPFQIPIGRFSELKNSVFTKGGLLAKRNGYGALASLSANNSSLVTTFNGDLTSVGTSLQAYSSATESFVSKGSLQPLSLSTLPIIRNNLNQTQCDSSVASNGLVCTAYTETDGTTKTYKYVVADSVTGQNIVAPTAISSADATLGTPRVFLLGSYFVIVFTNKVSTTYHLKYITISTVNPSNVTSATDISTSYTPASTVAFDGAVLNNSLYLAWNGAATSGIKVAVLSNTLSLSASINPDAAHTATMVSVCADQMNGVIWVSYYDSGSTNGYSLVVDQNLNVVHSAVAMITSVAAANLTSSANAGVMTLFYEVTNAYTYDSGVASNLIKKRTLTQSGVAGTAATVLRSVGLASKSFYIGSTIYFLTAYSSLYQPTYFLTDSSGNIIAKFAYQNGGGYLLAGLPSVSVSGSVAKIPYLFKDLIQAVNKDTNVAAGVQVNGIYSQTGINLASFDLSPQMLSTEIGNNLNLTGGFLWSYDGYSPVEQGFFLFPESIEVTTATGSGGLVAQKYFYQVTYEWSDNQGNLFRSAPSIPVSITTTTASSTNTINVPTLRLTYKTANPVKLVVYRWSTAQQTYYQVTSITSPKINDTTVDSIAITDASSDATILGNNIIYTNGGVVENIGGPAALSLFNFDDRLWLINSEDQNLLWYSKQVIESTPVELSDLFTIYVAPSLGAQGPTGPLTCGIQMDEKAILFKATAISYINGVGPDNTGASSQYSEPVFITATVGCSNQRSLALTPNGLMFEFASEAGNQIWLLGRNLSTEYIGAPVEDYTKDATVQSAVSVPGTNQIRFTMSSGVTLVYDHYYGQWDTFVNIPAESSTLYQGLHSYINTLGKVFQETPGKYLDDSSPVLMGFTTGWINLAGLQGYQRAYYFYLLGTYYSPHKLSVQIAYDYNSSPSQQLIIQPNNYSPVYGADPLYGSGSPYGGPSNLEKWRIFFTQQKCEAFQLTVQEIYDPSYGVVAGPGLTLSGINCVVGIKKGYRPQSGATSAG